MADGKSLQHSGETLHGDTALCCETSVEGIGLWAVAINCIGQAVISIFSFPPEYQADECYLFRRSLNLTMKDDIHRNHNVTSVNEGKKTRQKDRGVIRCTKSRPIYRGDRLVPFALQ